MRWKVVLNGDAGILLQAGCAALSMSRMRFAIFHSWKDWQTAAMANRQSAVKEN